MSSIDERERRNFCSFTPVLPLGLKDLLTVDLFSVYLLSRVDILIRYIEVDFTSGLEDCFRYIEQFVITRFIKSRFHLNCTLRFIYLPVKTLLMQSP